MSKEHTKAAEYQVQNPDTFELFAIGFFESLSEQKLQIAHWNQVHPELIYTQLEHPNWAPWLEASAESINGRATFFPEGQLLILDEAGDPIASLSTNRIQWDGNPETLPTWDDIAGDPSDYSQTYDPNGNTLVLMSMNVHPSQKGKQMPAKLVQQVQIMAHELGITHLIGSFRPSDFGTYKKNVGQNISFWEYATNMKTNRVDTDGTLGKAGESIALPIDGWLRSLAWLGMTPVKEDTTAMTVTVPINEFYEYQHNYHPESWWQDKSGLWHCSEVGSWYIDTQANTATYRESNLYGQLPLLSETQIKETT